jgi:rhamnosyltransferase
MEHGSLEQKVALIIPTLNAAREWPALLQRIRMQTMPLTRVIVVDSSSTDGTPELVTAAGFELISIRKSDFNHGRTRQLAASRVQDADFLVYMTQDALPVSEDSIRSLLLPFSNPSVGATYGRQTPRRGAGVIEAHARTFNYPKKDALRSWEDRHRLGIRAMFLSNSFAAYRRIALMAVGGFPSDTIIAEDALVAGQMLKSGWKIAYVSNASVEHSHNYGVLSEFKRYFDTGVYHERQKALISNFGTSLGEGKRFVISELHALWPRNIHLIPVAILRTLSKFVGYNLGRREASLSTSLKRKLSMHRQFWD